MKYNVGNRAFPSYHEASEYCRDNDFDFTMIIQEMEEEDQRIYAENCRRDAMVKRDIFAALRKAKANIMSRRCIKANKVFPDIYALHGYLRSSGFNVSLNGHSIRVNDACCADILVDHDSKGKTWFTYCS
jgi:hypothetical protein